MKLGKRIRIILSVFFLITLLMGCSSKSSSSDTFTLEQFQNEMKTKNYTFEVQDAQKDILQGNRKKMTIADKKVIYINVFNSKEEMEKEAKCLDSTGNVYTTGSAATNIDWVSYPHFYKKGTIIVQYIGEDEKIQSDLKDILGEQFAGYKK